MPLPRLADLNSLQSIIFEFNRRLPKRRVFGDPAPNTRARRDKLCVKQRLLQTGSIDRTTSNLKIDLHVDVRRTCMTKFAGATQQFGHEPAEDHELGSRSMSLSLLPSMRVDEPMLSMVATRRRAESRSGASIPRARHAPLNSSIRAIRPKTSGVMWRVSVRIIAQ